MKTLKEYASGTEGMKQMMKEMQTILDDFNFGAVYTAMKALSWAWSVPDGMLEEYLDKGKDVAYDPEYPELATFKPDFDDVERKGRNFLYDSLMDLTESDEYNYEMSGGGFEFRAWVLDDETRKRVYGEDAPDDFEHSVDIWFKFVIEENLPKSW